MWTSKSILISNSAAALHAPHKQCIWLCAELRQSIYIQVTVSLQQRSIFRRIAEKDAFATLERRNWQWKAEIRRLNGQIIQGASVFLWISQLSPEEEEKKRVRREKNKMAAAKCRNRRRELTDTLQAVS